MWLPIPLPFIFLPFRTLLVLAVISTVISRIIHFQQIFNQCDILDTDMTYLAISHRLEACHSFYEIFAGWVVVYVCLICCHQHCSSFSKLYSLLWCVAQAASANLQMLHNEHIAAQLLSPFSRLSLRIQTYQRSRPFRHAYVHWESGKTS